MEERIVLCDEEYNNLLHFLDKDKLVSLADDLKNFASRYKVLSYSEDSYTYKFIYNNESLLIITYNVLNNKYTLELNYFMMQYIDYLCIPKIIDSFHVFVLEKSKFDSRKLGLIEGEDANKNLNFNNSRKLHNVIKSYIKNSYTEYIGNISWLEIDVERDIIQNNILFNFSSGYINDIDIRHNLWNENKGLDVIYNLLCNCKNLDRMAIQLNGAYEDAKYFVTKFKSIYALLDKIIEVAFKRGCRSISIYVYIDDIYKLSSLGIYNNYEDFKEYILDRVSEYQNYIDEKYER